MGEVIDKVAWIHTKDNKILATLSKGKATYYIPGGKREGNETDEQTLFREIKEELDVEVVLDSIEYLEVYEAQSDGAKKGVNVKMTCYLGDYVGELKASSEIERFEWLSMSDIKKVSAVDKIIYLDLFSRGLIE